LILAGGAFGSESSDFVRFGHCAFRSGEARAEVGRRYFFFSSKWQRLQRTRALTKQLHFGQRFSLRAILRFFRGRMTMSNHSSDHRKLGGGKSGGKLAKAPANLKPTGCCNPAPENAGDSRVDAVRILLVNPLLVEFNIASRLERVVARKTRVTV